MLTFDEAMVLTRTVSSQTAFEDDECAAYFDALMTLEPNSLIVEVGLEYGRSSSIALQVAKEKGLRYVGIDPLEDTAIWKSWMRLTDNVRDVSLAVIRKKSATVPIEDLSSHLPESCPIAAILIDGDHSYEGVMTDLQHFGPHVQSGGYLMCHDYTRESLPEVTAAIFDFMTKGSAVADFVAVRTVGTLGIWRRM